MKVDDRIVRKRIIRKKIKKSRYLNSTKTIALVFIIGFFIVFMIDKFLLSVVSVDGNSMLNTLHENDKLIVKRWGLNTKDIHYVIRVYVLGI